MDDVASPCIDVCRIAESRGMCANCGRTLEEIAGWAEMTPSERREVMERLAEMGYPKPDA